MYFRECPSTVPPPGHASLERGKGYVGKDTPVGSLRFQKSRMERDEMAGDKNLGKW